MLVRIGAGVLWLIRRLIGTWSAAGVDVAVGAGPVAPVASVAPCHPCGQIRRSLRVGHRGRGGSVERIRAQGVRRLPGRRDLGRRSRRVRHALWRRRRIGVTAMIGMAGAGCLGLGFGAMSAMAIMRAVGFVGLLGCGGACRRRGTMPRMLLVPCMPLLSGLGRLSLFRSFLDRRALAGEARLSPAAQQGGEHNQPGDGSRGHPLVVSKHRQALPSASLTASLDKDPKLGSGPGKRETPRARVHEDRELRSCGAGEDQANGMWSMGGANSGRERSNVEVTIRAWG